MLIHFTRAFAVKEIEGSFHCTRAFVVKEIEGSFHFTRSFVVKEIEGLFIMSSVGLTVGEFGLAII